MRILCLAAAVTALVGAAHASSIQVSSVLQPAISGGTTYTYTITNLGTTGLIGFELSLPATPVSIDTPDSDWITNVFMWDGMTVVQWFSAAEEIAPGASLSGFAISSDSPAGVVHFAAMKSDFTESVGTTEGPVPEASTAGVTLARLLVLMAVRRNRM